MQEDIGELGELRGGAERKATSKRAEDEDRGAQSSFEETVAARVRVLSCCTAEKRKTLMMVMLCIAQFQLREDGDSRECSLHAAIEAKLEEKKKELEEKEKEMFEVTCAKRSSDEMDAQLDSFSDEFLPLPPRKRHKAEAMRRLKHAAQDEGENYGVLSHAHQRAATNPIVPERCIISGTQKREAGCKGNGRFATTRIAEKTLVGIYTGEIVMRKARPAAAKAKTASKGYWMQLSKDGEYWIAGHPDRDPMGHINEPSHSETANLWLCRCLPLLLHIHYAC